MRIAILSTFPDKKCGVGYYTYQLVQELRKSEEIEKLIVIGDLESTKADYMVDFKSVTLYKNVKKIIADEAIDLLQVHHEYYRYSKTNLNFLMLYYTLNVPVITRLSSLFSKDPDISLLERVRANVVEKVVGRKSKKIVVAAGTIKNESKNFPAKKVAQIPLGISPVDVTEKEIKNKKIALFFGMVTPDKGVEYLIKSSEYLKNVEIIVAGRPEMDINEVLSLEKEYSKYNKIILDLNWISDEKKDKYFKSADVVVIPYIRTSCQSGILYDAFAYGIPCVVSKGVRMSTIASEYPPIEVVNPTDPEDIARGITKILNNYSKYQDNVLKYQKIASWGNVAKMYVGLFRGILEVAA